ncbi:MAG: GAF domain-containing protein [Mogibacterium sp.]|nr:GAF domain-containing protein [Mogibacterium sp.]
MVDYALLCEQIRSLAEASADPVPVLANASALLYDALPDLNWAGFYLVRNVGDMGAVTDGAANGAQELLLGPFQGKPACVQIAYGKGVCGTAWAADATQLVPNVHEFPGHIACDSASNSEIVVPLHHGGAVAGVLDIDSPLFDRFNAADRDGLTCFARTLEQIILW